jgi:hypothetical protein
MTERTTVEFTQVGKRITFSAGYIIGMAPFSMRVQVLPPAEHQFGCAVVTQLGVVMVDEEFGLAYARWQKAMAEPARDLGQGYGPRALSSFHPLGNNAEF